MLLFSAVDKDRMLVNFEACSWQFAEAIARREGYTDLGLLIKEGDLNDDRPDGSSRKDR